MSEAGDAIHARVQEAVDACTAVLKEAGYSYMISALGEDEDHVRVVCRGQMLESKGEQEDVHPDTKMLCMIRDQIIGWHNDGASDRHRINWPPVDPEPEISPSGSE